MKILHVITGLQAGGAERMLFNLVTRMDSRFTSHVVSLGSEGVYGEKLRSAGIPAICLGMNPGRPSLTGLAGLVRTSLAFRPDIIQGWMYHGNLAGCLIPRRKAKTKLLWNIRQTLYSMAYEKAGTAFVIKAGAKLSGIPASIVYNSKLSSLQHEKIGFKDSKTILIPNGFDLDAFKPDSTAKSKLQKSLNLSPDSSLIGLIARYHPMKGHADFLAAAQVVVAKKPNVHFLMVGTGVDQSNQDLMNAVQSSGISTRIHCLGERKDVSAIVAGLDVLCVASIYGEGFPNVIGEAMASGVGCVVTDIGDSALILGEGGIAVEPGNPKGLSEGIHRWLDMEANERERIKHALRDRVTKNYSIASVARAYENLYEQLGK